jgi:uncharacterized protein
MYSLSCRYFESCFRSSSFRWSSSLRPSKFLTEFQSKFENIFSFFCVCVRSPLIFTYLPSQSKGENLMESLDLIGKTGGKKVVVNAYWDEGLFVNGVAGRGPQVIFSTLVLHWNVPGFDELSPQHFELFPLLFPKLDLLIVGTGEHTRAMKPEIKSYLKSHNIGVETMATWCAIGAFNSLNQEDRRVAGAFLPIVMTKNR